MSLEKDGVEVIKGVFTPEEMERLRDEAYLLEYEQIKGAGYKHEPLEMKGKYPALVFWPSLINKYIDKLRTDPRLVKIVKKHLGNNVKQINNQIYYRHAGDGDQFAWHQYVMFREPERFKNIEDGYLQTIIAVDNITEDNGAIEFIPGSHKTKLKTPDDLRRFVRGDKKGKKYTCKSGDVMIWSVMVVHGSEENISNDSRMTYMNGFAKAECVKDYPYYLKDGEIVGKIQANKIP